MTGRPPKPTEQQIAEGDPRKHGVHKLEQRLEAEPRAARGLPKCPAYLNGRARRAWKFWSEELEFMNLDCRPDAHMLEGACVAYEAAVDSYETIQKQGRLVAKRILDPETKSWVRPYYADIAQVEAIDPSTLRVRLHHPSGGLPAALAGYFQGIPMASPTSYATYGKDWVRHPAGTGPYMLKELVPGDHVTLVKNPTYHKPGLPYLDALDFRIMKDPLTASTALRTGQIDMISRVPVRLVPVLEQSKTLHVVTGPEMAPTVAFLNMRVKPFDDVRARRAVGGYGLNRAEIAQVAFQGRTQPLVSVLPRGVPGAST